MNRMPILIAAIVTLLAGVAGSAIAKEPDPEFMKLVFPPELVMRHASDIDLSPEQRKAITRAVTDTQAETLEIGWDMQEAAKELMRLLGAERVEPEATLEAATRVMELEVKVKRAHMKLLIQLKNQLDPAQQRKLRQLRE